MNFFLQHFELFSFIRVVVCDVFIQFY